MDGWMDGWTDGCTPKFHKLLLDTGDDTILTVLKSDHENTIPTPSDAAWKNAYPQHKAKTYQDPRKFGKSRHMGVAHCTGPSAVLSKALEDGERLARERRGHAVFDARCESCVHIGLWTLVQVYTS